MGQHAQHKDQEMQTRQHLCSALVLSHTWGTPRDSLVDLPISTPAEFITGSGFEA